MTARLRASTRTVAGSAPEPIQLEADRKVARASCFTAYRSYTAHILRSESHRGHTSRGVCCSFLHFSCSRWRT